MSGLIERLRKNADWLGCNYDDICDDMRQSADRIEQLEAACEDANDDIGRCLERIEQLEEALREIAGHSPGVTHGWAEHVRHIARTTLSP